jgi:peptidoglycan/LPS O-acetylase OafA/YrhL
VDPDPRLAVWTLAGSALALAVLQVFGRFSLPSHALICLIILAAGAIPVVKRSKWVEQAALVSFSMFISNEVVRIVYFGVVNAAETRLGLSEPVQWALWAVSMPIAVAFAVAFHFWLDMPLQRRLNRPETKPRRPLFRPQPAM